MSRTLIQKKNYTEVDIKHLFLILMCTFCTLPIYAAHLHLEREYSTKWCKAHNGKSEYRLPDKSRVDCLTDKYAVEFDFAPKWSECIGQALYYSKKTRKIPACVLILEDPEKEMRYVYKLRYTVYQKKKIPQFKTGTMTLKDVE